MVGFGLFNTSFQPEVEAVLRHDLWAVLRDDPEAARELGLSYLKIVSGLLVVVHYIAMLEHGRRLFLRANLSDWDLAGRAASPFRKLILLAVLTVSLFISQQMSDIPSLQ